MPKSVLFIAIAAALLAAALLAAGGAPASPADTVSVDGALTLDSFGNRLSVAAKSTSSGGATGHAVFQNGTNGLNRAPEVIRVRITCLISLTPSSLIVGGETEGASPGVGTIFPFYSFVLEDRGALPDKWTIHAQFSQVCTGALVTGPPVETAVGGNIVIH